MKIKEFRELIKSLDKLEELLSEHWRIDNIALTYMKQGQVTVRLTKIEKQPKELKNES